MFLIQKQLDKDKALLQQRVEHMEQLLREQQEREARMQQNFSNLMEVIDELRQKNGELDGQQMDGANNFDEIIQKSLNPICNDYRDFLADSKVF